MVVPITLLDVGGRDAVLCWMAFGHIIGVYSSSVVAVVLIHMVTAISIGIAVCVFLYKRHIEY